jgi:hypothetical protein
MAMPNSLRPTRMHNIAKHSAQSQAGQCQIERIRTEMASWLAKFEWEWWCTFTWRYDIHPYSARKCFEKFWQRYDVDYFYALEWFNTRDAVHAHALMKNTTGMRRLTIMDLWFAKYGIARIWAYNKKLGASFYCSKYIVKEICDWDIKITQQQSFRDLTF